MKIVQFKNGRFAVRKSFFFRYAYLDSISFDYWWTNNDESINRYASVATQEQAVALMEKYKKSTEIHDWGTPV